MLRFPQASRGLLKTLALLMGMSAFGSAALAQTAQLILTIDSNQAFARSSFAARFDEAYQVRAEELRAENSSIIEELEREEQSLAEQRQVLNEDQFRPLAIAFDTKVDRIRRERDRERQALAQLQANAFFLFTAQLAPVLEQIMRERGSVVLLERNTSTLRLSDPAIDITDLAISQYNRDFNKTPEQVLIEVEDFVRAQFQGRGGAESTISSEAEIVPGTAPAITSE